MEEENGKVKVNLLLNRASAWADVNSYLPYSGRVDIKAKDDCNLSVRIPGWVADDTVTCMVNNKSRKADWEGRYLNVGRVKAEDRVQIEFPLQETTQQVKIQYMDYIYTLKGNEIVHVEPQGYFCPIYQREKYRSGEVQWKDVDRFVARDLIDW